MRYFPFFFDLRRRRVLIVGGGEVAERKAALLSRSGAVLVVVAPRIVGGLQTLAEKSGGEVRHRCFVAADLAGCTAAVVAVGDDAVNEQVVIAAKRRRVPVNVVDNPRRCDFIFPAIAERGDFVAAVSSGGDSPVLARMWRAHLEEQMPPRLGYLAQMFGEWRNVVADTLPPERRRLFWEAAVDSPAAEAALGGNVASAQARMQKQLRAFVDDDGEYDGGEVYLIGAGPGDADLMTFRAHRLLQKADVVVYDRLVSAAVLDLARRDATKLFVGKCRGARAFSQEDINALLIQHAKSGAKVARVKGGDPFVFGRGGEEMAALRKAGVAYVVVPGVSAANGCAAAAQIPLTQRDIAGSVRFVTVRGDEGAAFWHSLAEDEKCTLVFYMAGAGVAAIAENLIAQGKDKQTPAALVCAGATCAQRVFCGMLHTIAAKTAGAAFSPALFIVGAVAAFGEESKPLANMPFPFPDISDAASARFANG
ncbi:MAG: siroheme synthase CysG [Gammaproteobacteria bacterium]